MVYVDGFAGLHILVEVMYYNSTFYKTASILLVLPSTKNCVLMIFLFIFFSSLLTFTRKVLLGHIFAVTFDTLCGVESFGVHGCF